MSRKGSKKTEEPEDPLNKELMEDLKSERLSTALKQNQYEQKAIAAKLKQLEDSEKQNFLYGTSVSETKQIAEELAGNKVNLFLVLGNFVDRSKKMKPEEFRKELLALVKMIPLADQSDKNEAFLAGMKKAADLIEAVQAAGLKKPLKSASSGSKDFGGKPAGAASKEPSSNSQNNSPLLLVVNKNSGSADAGCDITIPFKVYGGIGEVHFMAGGLPGLEGRITKLDPLLGSSSNLEGQWTLTVPESATPGTYQLTLVAIDSKGRVWKEVYFLMVGKRTSLSPGRSPTTVASGGAESKPGAVKGTLTPVKE
jgi:hypothetical protein